MAPVGSPLLVPQGGGGTQREGGGQKMVTSQAGADRSDLPLPRAQEEPGEVSGTGAAEQPRGTTTRLRGIRRQRLPGREHGGAAGGTWGGRLHIAAPPAPRNRRIRRGKGKKETENLRAGERSGNGRG